MIKASAVAAALSFAAIAAPGHAVVYDALASFHTAGSAFSYGSGVGAGFTLAPNFTSPNCVASSGATSPGLACYNFVGNDYTFPAIGKNISGSTLNFYTNVLPTDMLFAQSLPGKTATIRFTAPKTAVFSFAGIAQRIDTSDGSGDGVDVGVAGLVSAHIGTTYGASQAIDFTTPLTAGTTVDFYVDALTNTYNDGTGFQLDVTAVPEPAMWGLMIAGFGLVGVASRRRRGSVAA